MEAFFVNHRIANMITALLHEFKPVKYTNLDSLDFESVSMPILATVSWNQSEKSFQSGVTHSGAESTRMTQTGTTWDWSPYKVTSVYIKSLRKHSPSLFLSALTFFFLTGTMFPSSEKPVINISCSSYSLVLFVIFVLFCFVFLFAFGWFHL